MRNIINLQPLSDFLLRIEFDNSTQKVFDMKPYLKLPVFCPLNDAGQFKNVVNKGYFIEWPALEIDLSADTLWHEAK